MVLVFNFCCHTRWSPRVCTFPPPFSIELIKAVYFSVQVAVDPIQINDSLVLSYSLLVISLLPLFVLLGSLVFVKIVCKGHLSETPRNWILALIMVVTTITGSFFLYLQYQDNGELQPIDFIGATFGGIGMLFSLNKIFNCCRCCGPSIEEIEAGHAHDWEQTPING